MSNILQNNFHNLKIRYDLDEYWDFFIAKDDSYGGVDNDTVINDCLCSYIDVCDKRCTPSGNTWLMSIPDYSWDKSTAIAHTMYDITFTGWDNGLFNFRKDRIMNKDFIDLYQNQSYRVENNDTRLKLHAVSGSTLQYDYPVSIEPCQIKLNGGFYQGFFKTDCNKYQILPSSLDAGYTWDLEFELKKCDIEKESDKTLNDKYPDNKGIFFYIGTRAENKWVYLYRKDLSNDDKKECFDSLAEPNVDEFYVEDTFNLDNYTDYAYGDYKTVKTDDDYFYLTDEDLNEFPSYSNKEFVQTGVLSESCERCLDETIPVKKVNTVIPFYRGCSCRSCGCIASDKVSDDKKDDLGICPPYLNWVMDDGYIDFSTDGIDDDYDYLENDLSIDDFTFSTSSDINLSDSNKGTILVTDNKFLMFDRTCTGFTVSNWIDGMEMEILGKRKDKFKGNLFLLMDRTSTGYTVNTIDELRDSANTQYDDSEFYGDIYNNALAFRIKDDGSIGYRLLTKNCDISGGNKTYVMEGYSLSDVIKDCEWATVHVRIDGGLETMKIRFYVNGKLVYITSELPKLNLRQLDEDTSKQEGVPYNISIGGGTQGLAETILPNYMINPTQTFPLEKYFAGSFIGYIKSFKFYDCALSYPMILSNYSYNKQTDLTL